MKCYLLEKLEKRPLVFVHTGKYGDLIILLPAWKHIFDETGIRPIVVTSREFGNIFEGVSYVNYIQLEVSWWKELGLARKYAESKFGWCITPKWWDDPELTPPPPPPGIGMVKLQMNGRDIFLDAKDWDSYMANQWQVAGFNREDICKWPLVFDRRNHLREQHLRQQWFRGTRPKILFCLSTSGTSPFPATPEIGNYLKKWMYTFDFVDCTKIRAERIFDMLGLIDHAHGMVTSDTSLLHLASASKTPYVAYINNGGSGSIPRGNCVMKCRYADAMKSMDELNRVFESWK